MDIKWKDGKGNILNANNERIIYFNLDTDIRIMLKKEEVKKITIEEGLMNIFKDFEDHLVLTIVIPKKNKRDSIKIFNEYDKTGSMLKGKSNNILLDLILDSSVILGNPLIGILSILIGFSILLLLFTFVLESVFGGMGKIIAKILVILYPAYSVISYVITRVKRKRMKEI